MAAGLGFKTFTTGEVLTAADTNGYLMQGVLVFASAAARDAAITSPQEGQCCYLKDTDAVLTYSGAAWVGFDDSNAIQNTIVDAKGDIVAASGSDTPARLAVGNNGETLVADSSTSTGLRYQSAYNGNAIINGGFDFWQRGTSFTGTAPYYNADRWNGARAGAAAGATWSQQSITGDLGTTPAQGVLYSLRVARDSGNASTAVIQTANGLDSATSIPLAGKTVVMSFYAKAGANYSAASSALAVKLVTGTGINQNYLVAGYTGSANTISQTATLTTSWQRFQYTATLPTTTTEIALDFTFTPVGTAGAADNFELAAVQLQLGAIATTFSRAGGTIQGELAACQRYYFRITGDPAANYPVFGTGSASGTGAVLIYVKYPVTMRVEPTSIDQSNLAVYDGGSVIGSPSSVTLDGDIQSKDYANINFAKSASFTQFRPYALLGNANSAAYLGLSAEL